MSTRKNAFTTIALAAAGAFTVGGVALANAGAVTTATGALTSYTHATTTPNQQGQQNQQGPMGRQDGRGPGGHQHTEASATETAQVKAAVKAKDSAVTVEHVSKDADGSFDAFGTKSGQRVMVEVSKDLKTVTVRAGGPGDHRGRDGHGFGTAATAAQTAQVKAAVKAKDASVTVEDVRVSPDGSFHARATKGGQRVMVEVSKDLKTVTVRTSGPGDHRGRDGHGFGTAATTAQTAQVKAAVKAKDSAVTVEDVRVSPDGSFHARATKGGQRVMVEVSKDLKTVTVHTFGDRQGPQGAPGGAPQGSTSGTPGQAPTAATSSATA